MKEKDCPILFFLDSRKTIVGSRARERSIQEEPNIVGATPRLVYTY
jgi:hypothetical protein